MYKNGNIVYIDTATDLHDWFEGTIDNEFKGAQSAPVIFSILNGINADSISNINLFPRENYTQSSKEMIANKYNYYYSAIIGRNANTDPFFMEETRIELQDNLNNITFDSNNDAYACIIPPSLYEGNVVIQGLNWRFSNRIIRKSYNSGNEFYHLWLCFCYNSNQNVCFKYNKINGMSITCPRLYFNPFIDINGGIANNHLDFGNIQYCTNFVLFNNSNLIQNTYVECNLQLDLFVNPRCNFSLSTTASSFDNFGLNITSLTASGTSSAYSFSLFNEYTTLQNSYVYIQSYTKNVTYFSLFNGSNITYNHSFVSTYSTDPHLLDFPVGIKVDYNDLLSQSWLENEGWNFVLIWEPHPMSSKASEIFIRLPEYTLYKKDQQLIPYQIKHYVNGELVDQKIYIKR